MVLVRGLVAVLAFPLILAVGAASAQPLPQPGPQRPSAPPPPPRPGLAQMVGVAEAVKLTTPAGFIDDVVATDDQRIAYVVADPASKAELHVYAHATRQEQIVDLAPVTLQPIAMALVGPRAFVVGKTADGSQIAALIELAGRGKGVPAGTVVYRLGPAAHITVITRDGKPRVAVHRASTTKDGTRHDVELVAIETGRRIGAVRPFALDATDRHAKLELRVNHWTDGMTRAHGILGGAWDRKENARGPDLEATYDLITGKLVEQQPIEDLFEQRRRFQALADAGNRADFVRLAWDNSGIQMWRAGKPRAVELDQPLASYDPKSIQSVVNADGPAWIALRVDPVNAEAVARKKADPEYLDVFRVGIDGKAVRKARVLASNLRHRFGVAGERFWLIERTNGFERGGRSLTLYQLQ